MKHQKIYLEGWNGKLRHISIPAICVWSRKGSQSKYWNGSPKSANYGIEIIDPSGDILRQGPMPMKTKKQAERFVEVVAPILVDKYGSITLWYLAPNGKELIVLREAKQ